MILRDLLQWAEDFVVHNEARILLAHVLQYSPAQLIARERESVALDSCFAEEFKTIVTKRSQGIPIAYLTGQREFWSLPLYVNCHVLIPRHETELLVERALVHCTQSEVNILELGTGSGAISLALATELSDSVIIATDISEQILQVAKKNQENLKIANVEFLQGDWFECVPGRNFNLICSNPPYIASNDQHLKSGDLAFEPNSALVSAQQGYADLYFIIEQSPHYLSNGGVLILEHGFEQGSRIRRAFGEHGYSNIQTYLDLDGNERVTEGRTR